MKCQRLLDEDVFSGEKATKGDVVVFDGGHCYGNGFDLRVEQSFRQVRAGGDVILRPEVREYFLTHITDGTQCAEFVKIANDVLAPVTTPHHRDIRNHRNLL